MIFLKNFSRKIKIFSGFLIIFSFLVSIFLYYQQTTKIEYTYYYSDTCPKCNEFKEKWTNFKSLNPKYIIKEKNILNSTENKEELEEISKNENFVSNKSFSIPSIVVEKDGKKTLYAGYEKVNNLINESK